MVNERNGFVLFAKMMLMVVIIDHNNIFEVHFVQSAVSWRSYDKQYLWGLFVNFLNSGLPRYVNHYLACDYFPPGNVNGRPVYK